MNIRQAGGADAGGISAFLQKLTALGLRSLPDSREYVVERYIENPDTLSCLVAVSDAGVPLGMQVLVRAVPGNEYGLAEGWGIIGTHIDPDAARQGIGKLLFEQTHQQALQHGLEFLDATIGDQNTGGLAYYDRMGFQSYAELPGKIRKRFSLLA